MNQPENKVITYQDIFNDFKETFIINKRSIFNGEVVLTQEGVDYLYANFINNALTGDASFAQKIRYQMIDHPKETTSSLIQKQAIEIFATAVWLWRLPPYNSTQTGKINSVEEILNLYQKEDKFNFVLSDNPYFAEVSGIGSTGTYYNVNKPTEIAYIIKFLAEVLKLENPNDDQLIQILKQGGFNGQMQLVSTQELNEGQPNKARDIKNKEHEKPRTVSIHNALLHLIDPDNYEPIISSRHKGDIIKAFSKFNDKNIEGDIDDKLQNIRAELKKLLPEFKNFYDPDIINMWQGGLDFESKNIILHGAPGTGKTYLTEQAVKSRKAIEKNSEYQLVQFHPSYSYEDFIEGIKPIEIIETSGQMKFELKNGTFKQMCIDAFKSLVEADKNKTKPKTYYFIADEINRAELSRVFGELLLCIEDDKRLKVVEGKVTGTKVKTPNSGLWKKEHAVVIVNKEDDSLADNGEYFFGVPENIYFIGTMNDIDRSVDSFDMALRRRFVWKHYRYNDEPIAKKYKDEPNLERYLEICNNLNDHITSNKKEGLNLSDSYEIGQSYFMKPEKINQPELDRVWVEHLAPLITEYLRSEIPDNEIEGKLKAAKKCLLLSNDRNSR